MSGNIDVTVENQLVRFVAPEPIDGDAVVEHLQGQRVGKMVIKALRRPRATLVIDPEGRITVHGTHCVEAARDAAKELLLRLGKDDTGLKTEYGPIIASFYFNTPIKVQSITGSLEQEKVVTMTDLIVGSFMTNAMTSFSMFGKTVDVSLPMGVIQRWWPWLLFIGNPNSRN